MQCVGVTSPRFETVRSPTSPPLSRPPFLWGTPHPPGCLSRPSHGRGGVAPPSPFHPQPASRDPIFPTIAHPSMKARIPAMDLMTHRSTRTSIADRRLYRRYPLDVELEYRSEEHTSELHLPMY